MYGLDPTTPVEATATPVDEYEFEEGGSIDMVVLSMEANGAKDTGMVPCGLVSVVGR
jgi:hypothetical protein